MQMSDQLPGIILQIVMYQCQKGKPGHEHQKTLKRFKKGYRPQTS